MKKLKTLIIAMIAVFTMSLMFTTAQAEAYYWNSWSKYNKKSNIVEWLEKQGDYDTLIFALEATGLDQTLENEGPFTLFAPNDDAFDKVPQETLNALIADPDALANVLLYHVVDGKKNSFRLLKKNVIETLQGDPVLFVREGYSFFVNDSLILSANNRARNGIVHEIDNVLLPPAESLEVESVVDVLKLDGRFNTLLTALEATGLDAVLADIEAVTLFAPTDEAFEKVGEETINALLADPDALANILLYHVVDKKKRALRLIVERKVPTLQGEKVEVRFRHRNVFVNDSKVINANIYSPNAVIHTIDTVLIPEN